MDFRSLLIIIKGKRKNTQHTQTTRITRLRAGIGTNQNE